jgi:hypothetical protein
VKYPKYRQLKRVYEIKGEKIVWGLTAGQIESLLELYSRSNTYRNKIGKLLTTMSAAQLGAICIHGETSDKFQTWFPALKSLALNNIREVRILSAISVSTDDPAIRDTAQRMMKDIHERSRHEEAPVPF